MVCWFPSMIGLAYSHAWSLKSPRSRKSQGMVGEKYDSSLLVIFILRLLVRDMKSGRCEHGQAPRLWELSTTIGIAQHIMSSIVSSACLPTALWPGQCFFQCWSSALQTLRITASCQGLEGDLTISAGQCHMGRNIQHWGARSFLA